MNPAYSVILFTTASGAGYGLLALIGLVGFNHGPASSTAFALTCLLKALALITIGLFSSTFHLGHPERAWRAFSQWRSSWLSREGLLAVFTYPLALIFGAAWAGYLPAELVAPFGLLSALMSIATIYCTGKIYQSLITIPAWHTPWTVPVYIAFAIATGGAILATFSTLFDRLQIFQLILVGVAILLTLALKIIYWRWIDTRAHIPTTGHATGLGENVRQWELPHTATNFIQKEMGYVVARKHADKLRALVIGFLFIAFVSTLLASFLGAGFTFLTMLAALIAAILERWLFFAEARHMAIAYYQG
jgi:sulfite dehydrogenase (quinone) subunit SoeC